MMRSPIIQRFENLAVVGMSVAWAGCDSLDAFMRRIYEGSSPEDSLKTAPPFSLEQVARQALQDAGVRAGQPGMRVAVFVAGAAPGVADWPWAAVFTDLSAQAHPLAAAIEAAGRLLESRAVDLVLFAAISGASDDLPEDAPLRPAGQPGMGFDRLAHGWRLARGAGAAAFMRSDQALHEGRRVYAQVRSLASTPGQDSAAAWLIPPLLEAVRSSCQNALTQAGVQPEQVGYIETFASGWDALDGIEIAGLAQAYRRPETALTTALGSVQANTGYLGAAAGVFGLIQAALCLDRRVIPGVPGWTGPKLPALWKGTPFYVSMESRAWFARKAGPERIVGLNLVGKAGSFAHVILAEAPGQPVRRTSTLTQNQFFLMPLVGESQVELASGLNDLRRSLASGMPLAELAGRCYEQVQGEGDAPYALSIVGHDPDEAVREIDLALKAMPGVFEQRGEWQTPLGSYFTLQPVGREGGVALVYPGAFNSYPGVGKDLFYLFPELFDTMDGVTSDLGWVMREALLYPRSLAPLTKENIAAVETQLLADPIAMLISGTALAILYTAVLRDIFKIQPQASFGYSLGENAMMFATGVWKQGDQAAQRLETSETFQIRLAGPQMAIREAWGMAPQDGGQESPLWSNYLVMAPPERVQEALSKEPRVYLTHVNTPRQVVIGGDPAACQRVLSALKASSLKAPFDYALHCEVMRSEYGGLFDLHDWPVEAIPNLTMYSAADDAPVTIERTEAAQKAIAHKIATMLTSPLDFPRLIRTVYDGGARVFIEAGAGSNCARWVDESLKGRPHLALSMNRRGADDFSTLVRTLARLYSHRVPMALDRLYSPLDERVSL